MKIQIKHNGKTYYLQSFPRNRQPVITPYANKAMPFDNLGVCKNLRDATLEYFPKAATIVS